MRPSTVHGRARRVDSRLHGCGAPRDEQGEAALQRQSSKMRAAIAALKDLEQCRKIRGGIAAGEVARAARRQHEFPRVDFVAANTLTSHVECEEGTYGRGLLPTCGPM